MQASNSSAQPPPLALQLLSIKERRLCTRTSYIAEKLEMADIDDVLSGSDVSSMGGIADNIITQKLATPLVLVITNQSDLSLHSLFLEVTIRSYSPLREVVNRLHTSETLISAYRVSDILKRYDLSMAHEPRLISDAANPLGGLDSMLDQWRERDSLKERDGVWRFSTKWDSLQPQRQRLLEPIPYAVSMGDAGIEVEVRVFADSLPKPLTLGASLDVTVRSKEVSAREIIEEFAPIVKRAAEIRAVVEENGVAGPRSHRSKRS